jgi:hypothetical protein
MAILFVLSYSCPGSIYVGGRSAGFRRRRKRRMLRIMKQAKVRPRLTPIPIPAPVERPECESPDWGFPEDEGDDVDDEDGLPDVAVADVDAEFDV